MIGRSVVTKYTAVVNIESVVKPITFFSLVFVAGELVCNSRALVRNWKGENTNYANDI